MVQRAHSALKRAAREMERNWKKTKLEVFCISWKESSITYREALKAARSAYFSTLLEENKQNPKSSKSTTCMLDPIPLLKEMLPEVIDPLLNILHSSLSLGYVPTRV